MSSTKRCNCKNVHWKHIIPCSRIWEKPNTWNHKLSLTLQRWEKVEGESWWIYVLTLWYNRGRSYRPVIVHSELEFEKNSLIPSGLCRLVWLYWSRHLTAILKETKAVAWIWVPECQKQSPPSEYRGNVTKSLFVALLGLLLFFQSSKQLQPTWRYKLNIAQLHLCGTGH